MPGNHEPVQAQRIGQLDDICRPIQNAPSGLKSRSAITGAVDRDEAHSQLKGDLVMRMKETGTGHAMEEKKWFAMQIASFSIGESAPVMEC